MMGLVEFPLFEDWTCSMDGENYNTHSELTGPL